MINQLSLVYKNSNIIKDTVHGLNTGAGGDKTKVDLSLKLSSINYDMILVLLLAVDYE